MARRQGWASLRPRTVVALATLAILSAACGSTSTAPAPSSSTSTSTTTTTSPTTSTTVPAADAAILSAYRAGWAAFEHAEADANPLDPELAATTVNPLLHQVEGYLVTDHQEGIVGRGLITLHPHVAIATTTVGTVLDCAWSDSVLVYKKTGKQVPPVTGPEHVGVKATLVLDGTTWKVQSQTITEGKCPSGY